MSPRFIIDIDIRGRNTFIVEARSAEEAAEMGLEAIDVQSDYGSSVRVFKVPRKPEPLKGDK